MGRIQTRKKKLLSILAVAFLAPLPYLASAYIDSTGTITYGPVVYVTCDRWYCSRTTTNTNQPVYNTQPSYNNPPAAHPSTYTTYAPIYNPGPNQPDGDSAWSKTGASAW